MRSILLMAIIGAAYAASPAVPASRIIGGYDTSIASNPHMANVKYSWLGAWVHHVCGGSIISNFYILTAAQCIHNLAASSFTIAVGSGLIDGSGGYFHAVRSQFTHPSFDSRTLVNDIGLMRVDVAMDLTNPLISNIDIAGATYSLATGTLVSALGWGTESLFGSATEQLQKVEYYTYDHPTCVAEYQNHDNYPTVTDRMICAANLEGPSKGICDGDVGGPVDFNGTVLVGIPSWTSNCDDFRNPDVLTSVSAFADWIVANAI